jgi:WXG100 family type VII secretion target
MTMIRVTPAQLGSVAGQLRNGAANIEGTLRQLAAQAEPLGSDWAGIGQARFLQLWAQWQRDAAGLNQALTEISALMNKASAQYESTDTQVGGSFNR